MYVPLPRNPTAHGPDGSVSALPFLFTNFHCCESDLELKNGFTLSGVRRRSFALPRGRERRGRARRGTGGAEGGERCHWPPARRGRGLWGGAARGLAGARSRRRRLGRGGGRGGAARGGGPRCGGRRWRRAGGGRGMEALPGERGPGRARPAGGAALRHRGPGARTRGRGSRYAAAGASAVSRGGPCGARRRRCLLSPRPGRTSARGWGAFWGRPAAPPAGGTAAWRPHARPGGSRRGSAAPVRWDPREGRGRCGASHPEAAAAVAGSRSAGSAGAAHPGPAVPLGVPEDRREPSRAAAAAPRWPCVTHSSRPGELDRPVIWIMSVRLSFALFPALFCSFPSFLLHTGAIFVGLRTVGFRS